ncbi:arylsulfatase A family protein [Catenovulum agarivorans DS-2]|uniref:Arylsulfatase A family protein n=1 Tax=Catenovulum agarivorans DS-2 TaxID=1328313 RepID=W7QPI0_9ALTE|nr:sulfatase [Catenovulum agarivorans]EWH09798.1 arylsulfatase A family protein [Catenovulum agarivorans DS-2]
MKLIKKLLLPITTTACLLSCSYAFAEQTANKPNILMIAIDDMNNFPGAWGGPAITPNIDRLAKQGIQFMSAHPAVPACNPSRVAIMTGLRPEITGQHENKGNFRNKPANKKIKTIPQWLADNGYKTAAAGKIFHKPRGTGAKPEPQSDPQSWHEQSANNTGVRGAHLYKDENGYAKWLNGIAEYDGQKISAYLRKFAIWGASSETTEESGDYQTAQYCNDYVKQQHDKPFFLACGIFRPHSPQVVPQKYLDMYPIESVKLPPKPYADMLDIVKRERVNFSTSVAKAVIDNEAEWKRAMQAYLASVTFADEMIGKIVDGLDNSQYKHNTIVVLWSDHGFQVGHKQRWEKFSLWNQATQSPFIMRMPNTTPSKINHPVSLLDIYPTLANILNIAEPHKMSGNNLLPLINNPNMHWDKPAVITYMPGNHAIRLGSFNYIKYDHGAEEFYDLSKDPNEYTNLINEPAYQLAIKKMRKYLPVE